jgi:hypothetical protein
MYVSGREALSAVENAINGVRTNESRLADVLRSAAQEAERLRQQLADSFRSLALIRLDALVRNEVVATSTPPSAARSISCGRTRRNSISC